MCMSAPKNKAAEEAAAAEKARQAAIAATQGRVNAVFDSPARQAEIERAVAAQRDLNTRELNREKANTDRQLKFALARNGQIGGSTQIDKGTEFAEAYARGLLGVERGAQGFGASIRGADQDARARLISLATAGLDATTGAQQAAEAMRVNLEAGKADRNASGVADVFVNFKPFIDRSRVAADQRRADGLFANLYGNPRGSMAGYGYGQ